MAVTTASKPLPKPNTVDVKVTYMARPVVVNVVVAGRAVPENVANKRPLDEEPS